MIEASAWMSDGVVDGAVSDLTTVTANVGGSDDESSARRLRDAFAEQVSVASAVLGEPTTRVLGAHAEAGWTLPDRSASLSTGGRMNLSCVHHSVPVAPMRLPTMLTPV